ncbi:DtxR family Mn-dependent transcriptional regulator [Desulfosalsimonas propionicica]|uniref:Transcriptional regulator MntR n=1 Tax=Desulfosalsimonas propionicica TaxID=332175 RepID=A0A7W0CAN5_9BACT|nr:metal-dependent transcriptional regulator [Desulfosalsimonas propionicica]MBA2882256.1 DtxR family Mn-dependent transcriptional regulator [Desulfosalsimonas propionicica]
MTGIDLSENLEDYLETILELEKTQKVARVKDIAEMRGVLRGSVTGALKSLAEKGLINYEPYSFITLTRKGTAVAGEINRRHRVIKNFLTHVLQLDPQIAEDNACRMEHAMDRAAVDRMVAFIDYMETCPRTDASWIQGFARHRQGKDDSRPDCKECMTRSAEKHAQKKK